MVTKYFFSELTTFTAIKLHFLRKYGKTIDSNHHYFKPKKILI